MSLKESRKRSQCLQAPDGEERGPLHALLSNRKIANWELAQEERITPLDPSLALFGEGRNARGNLHRRVQKGEEGGKRNGISGRYSRRRIKRRVHDL